MRIGIGIDTGGTFTDIVAYDLETKEILAKGKSNTTHGNLIIGISRALDVLPPENLKTAEVVCISTTLATNACIENKGGRAKLFIFGLTNELMHRFSVQENYGIPYDSVNCIDTNSSADGLYIDEPDWDGIVEEHGDWIRDGDIIAVSELFSTLSGAPCEKKFKALIEERFGKTCVCSNELTSEINAIQRGATALLNARLLPLVCEFIESIKQEFKKRGCSAPIKVVRSDGSLMSADFSMSHPVETILSGPASSVLAGKGFTDSPNYVVVDMGGTTTDVSIVKNNNPVVMKDGVKIASWKTSVKGIDVSPYGLGGDSAIRLYEGELALDSRRVMPLCAAASLWPEIKDMLRELLEKKHVNRYPLHEVFYLLKEPKNLENFEPDEIRLVKALSDRPCMIEHLKDRCDIDIYHFDSERLESEEVIMRCGLTPTDFMHIKGDFDSYDAEASRLAAKYLLFCLGREQSEENILSLADTAYELVYCKLYGCIIKTLLAKQYPAQFSEGFDDQMIFLINEAWKNREKPSENLVNCLMNTDFTLIGIGAPIGIFLPQVAKALNTRCIIPEHSEVANAIGALNANVHTVFKVDISQRLSSTGSKFYIAHLPEGSQVFEVLDEAVAAAKISAENMAREMARLRGAEGEIKVNTYLNNRHAKSFWGTTVEMGTMVISEVVEE